MGQWLAKLFEYMSVDQQQRSVGMVASYFKGSIINLPFTYFNKYVVQKTFQKYFTKYVADVLNPRCKISYCTTTSTFSKKIICYKYAGGIGKIWSAFRIGSRDLIAIFLFLRGLCIKRLGQLPSLYLYAYVSYKLYRL